MYLKKRALEPKTQFAISLIALGLVMLMFGYDKIETFFSEHLGVSTVNNITGIMGWVYFIVGIVIVIFGFIATSQKMKIEGN